MSRRTHSRSFDHTKLSTGSPNSISKLALDDPDFKPLKKAWTMLSPPTYKIQAPINFHHSDVLYRRHFNASELPKGLLKKGLSLEGLQGSWLSSSSSTPAPPAAADSDSCVIVVDCFSTGAMMAHQCLENGLKTIRVDSFDNPDLASMVPSNCRSDYTYFFTFDNDSPSKEVALATLLDKINATKLRPVAVIAGAETGVELADRLSEKYNVSNPEILTNGSSDTEARRNKYLMGEKVRAAGVRAVMQQMATTWHEIKTFLDSWNPSPFNVIVKPMESAGSDDVTLCHSEEQVKAAFGNIMGKVNSLGCVNEGVLVQEYLQGTEYVIDTCSFKGTHKVIALWEYDRRPTNGAGFVLHGQRLMSANEPRAKELIEYQFKVLDSLNIKNGPGHGEVKWSNGGPCLVEVGSRCHGAEGMWMGIATEVFGYNQVDATLDAYMNKGRFLDDNVYPVSPSVRKSHGCAKYLISFQDGTLKNYSKAALDEIKAMKSFRSLELFLKPGKLIKPTIDCFTWAGCVLMANADKAALNADYARIEELCESGAIYELSSKAPAPEQKKAVIVVDPFTTGAVLAAEIYSRGYSIVCVYSASMADLEKLLSFIPHGLELHFEAVIGQIEGFSEEKAAIYSAGEVLRISQEKNLDVVACVAGAETGVQLSDRLAEKLSLRGNGSEGTEARRNKFDMAEKLRAYRSPESPDTPTRAVMQIKTKKFDKDTEAWLADWNPVPFKAIVKPVESAGSDDVKLCLSASEVKSHVEYILSKSNSLGIANNEVLIQEYLEGEEFVVDSVSRDGVSKIVGIWQYDKVAVNGHTAPIVYLGQKTLCIEEEENSLLLQKMVDYNMKVLKALGIKNGPGHGEYKMSPTGDVCLVEIGSRCHGAEGCWREVMRESHGIDQVTATADCYLHPPSFEDLPMYPPRHKAYPRVVFMISYQEGILKMFNPEFLEEIKKFRSFRDMEIFVTPGQRVLPTTDCFTFVGNLRLCHVDEKVVQGEYDRIREMENSGKMLIFEDKE